MVNSDLSPLCCWLSEAQIDPLTGFCFKKDDSIAMNPWKSSFKTVMKVVFKKHILIGIICKVLILNKHGYVDGFSELHGRLLFVKLKFD